MLPNIVKRSFRDPDGITVDDGQRILRLLHKSGLVKLQDLATSNIANDLIADGKLIKTNILSAPKSSEILNNIDENWSGVAEHNRLPFVSYPHEWPAEMLYSAGNLTLELAEAFLEEGYGLKDATPYNIIFKGANPLFVDVLSIEKRQPLDSIWRAEAQFIRNFILPLLCWKKFGMPPHQLLLNAPDGITPDFVYQISSPLQRYLPPFLWWVCLPVWLGARAERNPKIEEIKPRPACNPDMAKFILSKTFRRLGRTLGQISPRRSTSSHWQQYEQNLLYTDDQVTEKQDFVKAVFGSISNNRILDIGCNTGSYGLAAAGHGHQVVAFDADSAVAGMAWQRSYQDQADISVLTANFAAPTPALGWNNEEWPALLPRFTGQFDLVMGLAVMHHLIVTSGIPLKALFERLAMTTTKYLLWEYVDPSDQNFRKIARGRDDLHAWLNPKSFEELTQTFFKVERKIEIIPNHRILYLFSKRHAA